MLALVKLIVFDMAWLLGWGRGLYLIWISLGLRGGYVIGEF